MFVEHVTHVTSTAHWRGVDPRESGLALRETTQWSQKSVHEVQYLPLSYVWDDVTNHMARAINIAGRTGEFAIERLPPTISDAIEITRLLGYRFLSVDAICIIQDFPEDIDTNIAMMETIYENATCVLAAMSAASAKEGIMDARELALFDAAICGLSLVKSSDEYGDGGWDKHAAPISGTCIAQAQSISKSAIEDSMLEIADLESFTTEEMVSQ